MYTAFYGLREKPFALAPDPRFLFLASSHREALAHDADLLVDVLVADLDVVHRDGEVVEGRQLQLRGDVDLGGEREGVVVPGLGADGVGHPEPVLSRSRHPTPPASGAAWAPYPARTLLRQTRTGLA